MITRSFIDRMNQTNSMEGINISRHFKKECLFFIITSMKKYTNETNDSKLDELLTQRRSPLLSNEGINSILQELTVYMTGDVYFFIAIYPKKEHEHMLVTDIEKADMMEGNDSERYLPAFTSIKKLKQFKPELKKGEAIYVFTKKDLLSFLEVNQKVAAVVLNPMEDDLLLHRMLLQNLIQVGSQEML